MTKTKQTKFKASKSANVSKKAEGTAVDQQAVCEGTGVKGTEVARTADRDETAEINEELSRITGVRDTEVANQILLQMGAMQIWGADRPNSPKLAAAVGMMDELKPANATEA